MNLIDTHCHLNTPELYGNLPEILSHTQSIGIRTHIVPSTSTEDIPIVNTLCRHYPNCLPAYGIHPSFINQPLDAMMAVLESALQDHSAVAIGEIGIDLYHSHDDFESQKACFCAQLAIARQYHLPVLLHIRRSADRVIPLLKQYKIESGIAHAFSGSMEQAQQLLKLGIKIGIGGVVTYPNAHKIRHIAANLPQDAIVLETDAPFLPPVWLKGQPNMPYALTGIAQSVAELRGITIDTLANITTKNASVVFGLSC